MFRALAEGRVDLVLAALPNGNHWVRELRLPDVSIAGELSLPGITEEDLRIGVRPDLQPLAELLDRALSAISATERRTIENRWLGAGRIATAKAASIQLTQAESSWLDVREQQINICVYQDWMPLEGVDIGRQHAGMTANVLTLFQQRLPIHFKLHNTLDRSSALAALQSGQCDLLPLAIQTHEISQQLHFSAPWLTLPSVVLGRLEAPFINSLEELNGLPVGVSRDQGLLELVQQRYPELDLVPVDSEQEGLRRLQTGELYAYIGALNSVSYYLQELRMVDVRVIGRVPVDLPLSMATRQDDLQLQAIVQKLLSSLTQAERQGIESDWRRVRLEQRMDYSLLWKTLALVSLVLLVLFYWNRKLGTLNRKLAEANQQLALMSRCDQLTGLGNRIYVEQELPPLFNASKQKQQTFMLAVLDADHFKQVNDTRGHPVGDLCLQALAGLLQDSCNGKQQHVVRFGGEEFLIFAAGHSAETFRQLLESIREQVAALVINTGSGVPLQLTVSLGAQIRRPAVDEQLDDWMREVDQALYQAKQQGRNRVVLTSGSEVSGAG
jgi:polar amino acid transport system substrate-binding protein